MNDSYMNPLISIIVPVYNVEPYIERCIESLINQTYVNIEILLVDDGSRDNSGVICDRFAKLDKRIKVFHKENGGLSDARNYGLDRANGEYISFIDSDDYVDIDYIEFLYNLINEGYKLALCSLHVVFTSNNRIVNKGNNKKYVLDSEKCIEMMCYQDEVDTAAYAKMAHKSLYKDLRFPKGKLFEDIGTTYLLFDQCEKIICDFTPKYYYIIRENSIVTSKFNSKKLDLIEMTDKMASYVNRKYINLKKATLRRQCYARFSTLNQMLNIKDAEYLNERKKIVKFLRTHGLSVICDKKTPNRDRVAFLCIYLGYPVYKIMWKLFRRVERGI